LGLTLPVQPMAHTSAPEIASHIVALTLGRICW
jgi:hypothetical protein